MSRACVGRALPHWRTAWLSSTTSNRQRATGSNRCATGSAPRSRRSSARRAATPPSPSPRGTGPTPTGEPGGGGVRGLMNGKVFEKVGVNVSTVGGRFSRGIRAEHPRRRGRPELLRHRDQPRRAHGQPARSRGPHEHPLPDHDQALVRRRRRPQPAIPYDEDTEAFHARLRAACAAHDPTFYPRFRKWAEEYF